MARSFSEFIVLPYLGTPFFVPVSYCGVETKAVPLDIDWTFYGASAARPQIGVAINMQIGGVQAPLEAIRGIVIDNTASSVPVYVVFQNGFVVTCQANAQTFAPAMATSQILTIYADGFTDAVPPLTRVFLFDKAVSPFTNVEIATVTPLWIASPSIQRPGISILQQNYGSPALIDQVILTERLVSAAGSSEVLAVQTSGFYYLGAINCTLQSVQNNSDFAFNVYLRTITDQQNIFRYRKYLPNVSGQGQYADLLNLSGFNIKIDARKGLELYQPSAGSINNGFLFHTLAYTFNPNV